MTSTRSRTYTKSTEGETSSAINYEDIGDDRKWKIDSSRPIKNVDLPSKNKSQPNNLYDFNLNNFNLPVSWNVTGVYTPVEQKSTNIAESAESKQQKAKNVKKIDL